MRNEAVPFRRRLVGTPIGKALLRLKLLIGYPGSGSAIYKSRWIEGWLTDGEADRLFKLAQGTPDDAPVVVELGSWKGKSSSLLAAGLQGKRNPRLFSVDTFGRDESDEYHERYYSKLNDANEASLENFNRNMARCGVTDIVHPIKAFTYDAIKGWELPIDVLFIDANHEYDAVLRDFELWSPHVKRGGIVAFHDTFTLDWPGPTRVVQEKLVAPGYGELGRSDSLSYATKLES